jgi:hypothetical protein
MSQLRLLLSIEQDDDDAEALDRVARRLRDRLLELPIDDVQFVTAPPGPGGKGAGEVVAGMLAVLSSVDRDCLEAVIAGVRAFLRPDDGRRIHVRFGDSELTVDGASAANVSTVIEAFVSDIRRDAAR